MTQRLLLVVVAAYLSAPAAAFAQAGGEVTSEGYVVGGTHVIVPSVGLETGYISNVFYETEEENPVESGILRLIAGLTINPAPQTREEGTFVAGSDNPDTRGTVLFSGSAELRYNEFLTSNEAAQDQRSLAGELDANVSIFAKRAFSILIRNNFVRDTRPTNFEGEGTIARDLNRFTLSLRWKPPGRTVWATLAYQNLIDRFEDDDNAFANRLQHTFSLRGDWQYLPVTRFYASVAQGIYGSLDDDDNIFGGMEYKQSSYPLRTRAGVASALTEFITTRLEAGWATGFYDEGASFNSVELDAEVGYRYSPFGRVVVGGSRRFQDSINANYFGDWEARIALRQQIAKVLLSTQARYIYRRYEGIPDGISMTTDVRQDDIFDVQAVARYYYREWLSAFAGYTLLSDSTDFREGDDDPSYIRHEVVVGVAGAF